MDQSCRSKMGQTSHLSDAYDAFSSSCFIFSFLLSLMTMSPTNQMMKFLGPGSLPVYTFLHILNYPLIMSDDCYLVESQYSLVVSVESS